jgi:hypothetical protein
VGRFTVAGWLEPANAVGGDTFDYALDRDRLHVSITDAVGHDVHATGADLRDDATVVCLDWNGGPVQGLDGTPMARPV